MTERRATDHIVNLDIPGSNDVTRRNRRTRPLLSIRGGGKIEVRDSVEIGHTAIVGMPLLHCLPRSQRGSLRQTKLLPELLPIWPELT